MKTKLFVGIVIGTLLFICLFAVFVGHDEVYLQVVSSDRGPSLHGAIELLLESGFNCSSRLHWSSMVTLLASKSDSFSSKERDIYSQCIATAQSKCLQQTSRGKFESRLLQRRCHKWSEMRFLSSEGAGGKDARFIALASYPGSGNTWVRMILEELTGVFTGSVYCDSNLLFSGLFGAFVVSDRVLVVKTHQSSLKGAKGVIVVVRNPFHAIVSSLAFKTTRSHSATVSFGELTDKLFQNNLNYWQMFLKKWLLNSTLPSLILSYDNLISDFEQEIRKLVSFIDFPVSEEVIKCVVGNREKLTSFKRRQDKGGANPYSQQQASSIRDVVRQYKALWKKHNIKYNEWAW